MIDQWNETETCFDYLAQKIARLFCEYAHSLLQVVARGVSSDAILQAAMEAFMTKPFFRNAPEADLEKFAFDLSCAVERFILREYDAGVLQSEIDWKHGNRQS